MTLYPAIDILGGRCVRLEQGDFARVTEYSADPAEQAVAWERCGDSFIHVVDLDGARRGSGYNGEAIREITEAVSVPIQVGGGIRSIRDIERHLSSGVSRVVLGTAAVRDPGLVLDAIREYGDKIAVGVDSKEGRVAIEGWGDVSSMEVGELCSRMKDAGASTVIHTDISRDGMMTGPNLEASGAIVRLGLNVIVSGGVSSMEDLYGARDIGAGGAIIGKALYRGAIDLSEAVRVFEGGGRQACLQKE
ncbi:MAG: 1-(5-phosphoribosyl)-5-[(5-phosphoribosylamino)methylideneamino]imidazole-4-carboxamide isomerase [Synergistaceae bacterium]|jgi:phosphoribosylformimino-5-aminoimidazole carboxamide ribotide isomerase|nr:1-(5-phosphoribosyl)-5-[(5-phosphoribosylamino)methylideneamino]imidazole-4-carboxamide isomerase [Synergistaceae bacterium]